MNPRCIRYGASGGGSRRRLGFTFSLSEPAIVVLGIQRRLNSRTRPRCPVRVSPGDAGRFGPPIIVKLPAGGGTGEIPVGEEGEIVPASRTKRGSPITVFLHRTLDAGRRRVVLRQSSTALPPGTYVATLVAATADGRTAYAGHVKFWVLERAR